MKKNEAYISTLDSPTSPINKYDFFQNNNNNNNTTNRTNRVRSISTSSSNKNFYLSDGEEENPTHDNDVDNDNEDSRPVSGKEDANDIEFSNLLRRPRPVSYPYSLNEPPDEFVGYR